MKRVKHFMSCHWPKFAWGGTGSALGILGSQLDKPYATWCFIAAAICAIISANMRSRKQGEDYDVVSHQ